MSVMFFKKILAMFLAEVPAVPLLRISMPVPKTLLLTPSIFNASIRESIAKQEKRVEIMSISRKIRKRKPRNRWECYYNIKTLSSSLSSFLKAVQLSSVCVVTRIKGDIKVVYRF